MTLTAIPLVDCDMLPEPSLQKELGQCGICQRGLASVMVVDDEPSKILGDPLDGAEFLVCPRCAEIVVPVAV